MEEKKMFFKLFFTFFSKDFKVVMPNNIEIIAI